MRVQIRINGSYLSFPETGNHKELRMQAPETPYADSGFLSIQIALSEGVLALQVKRSPTLGLSKFSHTDTISGK